MSGIHDDTLRRFEEHLATLGNERYMLTLYVSGASGLSARAVSNIRALCDTYLSDRYQLEVVDVHQHPELMANRGVLAAPTLIKDMPLPMRTLVGDMSDARRILIALDVVTGAPRTTK